MIPTTIKLITFKCIIYRISQEIVTDKEHNEDFHNGTEKLTFLTNMNSNAHIVLKCF